MKKILVVSSVPTHPINAGNRMWIYENCMLLRKLGCEIHFLYVYVKSWKQPDSESIQQTKVFWGDNFHLYKASFLEQIIILFKKKVHYYLDNKYNKCDDRYPIFLQKKVKELDSIYKFDFCIVQYFYLTKLFEYIKRPVRVLATHDNFAYKDIVVGQSVSDCLDANQSARAMQRAQIILSLNSKEQVFFEMLSPRSKVYTVYNHYEYHPQPIANNRNILYLSGASPFNINGLNWFLKEIFPSIVERFPDCKLIIGGSICKKLQYLVNDKNIVIQGGVADIDAFYRQGDICINPTYQGTGLKTKTFEAVSYDKVEIAHPHSSLGIYSKDNAPICFSSNAKEWVSEIERMWSNENQIVERKKENENYIRSLQKYVRDQYIDMLNFRC